MVNHFSISCYVCFHLTIYIFLIMLFDKLQGDIREERNRASSKIYKNAPNISIIYSRETIRWIPREAIKQCNEKNEQINFSVLSPPRLTRRQKIIKNHREF